MAQGIFVHRGAERTEVMMVAHAFELARLAVQLESLLRRIADSAETEARIHFIQYLLAVHHTGPCDIQIRLLRAPQLRVFHRHFGLLAIDGCHYIAVIKDVGTYLDTQIFGSDFVHRLLQVDVKGHQRFLFAYLRCANQHSEGRDVYRIALHKMYISV